MKTRILASSIMVIAVLFYVFSGSTSNLTGTSPVGRAVSMMPPADKNISNRFLIAAMDDGKDYDFTYLEDSLGLNLWHMYCGAVTDTPTGKHYPDGWTHWAPNDHLLNDIGDYAQEIHYVLTTIGSHHMQAFLHRPKIDYLCYGQRSDYQCEDMANIQDQDLWFYTFQSPGHIGSDIPDSGAMVRFCNASAQGPGHDDPGLVVSRLRTNNEQCHVNYWTDQWRCDNECDWYIKPRIRIDSAFANNQANLGTLVCRVDVYNQDGYILDHPDLNKIKSIDIRVRNFRINDTTRYKGQYLEVFNFGQPWNDTSSQVRSGQWGVKWYWSSRGNHTTDEGENMNRCDIQVYWYGNCDMWIDYVRVDNDIANDLFHGVRDDWLQGEAQQIACSAPDSVALKFYIELNEFNNIPAMAYVNKKLDEYCGKHVDLIADQLTFYQYHMNWDDRGKITKAGQIVKEYVDKIGMTQTYYGCYPFTSIENPDSTYSRIPNTLPIYQGSGVLAKAIAPADYDAWLQMQLDTICDEMEGQGGGDSPQEPCDQQPQHAGMYQWAWKLTSGISKLADIPIIADVQIHQWVSHCGEVDREPTNEELDLSCNLPVSYGAKGMVMEIFNGDSWGTPPDYTYTLGFTNIDHTPRYTNVYGQPKWEKLKSIIQRLNTWGPYLMSFNNTQINSYIYRSERMAMMTNSYILDVVPYKPGSGIPANCVEDNPEPGQNPPDGLTFDCKPERYLQVATFQDITIDPKYFMIVNRRCSPYIPLINENGGHRIIKIRFDANKLGILNTWKITNLGDNTEITFNKINDPLVNLGDFDPGEGKLYKMEPVP